MGQGFTVTEPLGLDQVGKAGAPCGSQQREQCKQIREGEAQP